VRTFVGWGHLWGKDIADGVDIGWGEDNWRGEDVGGW
jgi:hypothetical protein